MSVSKWAYEPDKCDGDICVGDCDLCSKAKFEASWQYDMERYFIRANPIEIVERAVLCKTLTWKLLNLRCSNCGHITMVWSSIDYKYCPHCGKRMRAWHT